MKLWEINGSSTNWRMGPRNISWDAFGDETFYNQFPRWLFSQALPFMKNLQKVEINNPMFEEPLLLPDKVEELVMSYNMGYVGPQPSGERLKPAHVGKVRKLTIIATSPFQGKFPSVEDLTVEKNHADQDLSPNEIREIKKSFPNLKRLEYNIPEGQFVMGPGPRPVGTVETF